MIDIEEYIIKNKDLINDEEPYAGHYERFQHKKSLLLRKSRNTRDMLKIAATAIVLLGFGFLFRHTVFNSNIDVKHMQEQLPAEFIEYENFTMTLIDEKVDHIDHFRSSFSHIPLKYDLKKFESSYKALKKDLIRYPNDKRIIEAMVYHLQVQLEILDQIINQLESQKQSKKKKYYENNKV